MNCLLRFCVAEFVRIRATNQHPNSDESGHDTTRHFFNQRLSIQLRRDNINTAKHSHNVAELMILDHVRKH